MSFGRADGSLVFETELDNDGFERGSKKLQSSVDSLCSSVNKFGAGLQKSVAGYASSVGEVLSREYAHSVTGAAAMLEDLGNAEIPTEEYKKLSEEAEKAGQKLEKLLNRQEKMQEMGVSQNSAQWKSLQYDLDLAAKKYDALEVAKTRMENDGSAFMLGRETAEYKRLSAELERLQSDISKSESVTYRFAEKLRSAGRSAITTAKNLATLPFRVVASGMKQAAKELKQYSKQATSAKTLTNSLTRALTSFRRLLVARVKSAFISGILSNAQEGMQRLAQFSAQFNATMSEMKNSAKQLSGNIAVSIGNIISAVEPVILRLINILSQAVTHLNQFFALLNGKKTVTVAKKGVESYADAAGTAASAQKKFNAELYGYDELTRQSKQDSSGAGASGIEYEEIPIDFPQGVTDWIERLKETWKTGDWYGVGQVLSEGLNVTAKTVDDWINNTLRPKGVEWAARIATILNGLFDGVNWKLLGKTVADGFNAIVDIIVTFFQTLSFKSIVQAVEDFLASALQNINPLALLSMFFLPTVLKAVKSLIAAHPVLSIVIGAILALGPQLGETLKKMVDNIDFEAVGKAISDGFTWVISRLTEALASVDWYELGNALMQGLIDMIASINWLQVLATLAGGIVSLVGGAVELLLGLIGGLSEKLADAFTSVGEDTVAGFFQGIADAMSAVASVIKKYIVDPVVNAVKDFLGIHSPSTVFAEIGNNLIQGLFEGISNAWHTITDFFSNVLPNLGNVLSAAWNDMKATAINTWNAIQKSLSNAWNSIKNTAISSFPSLKTSVMDKWNGLKTSMKSVEWGSIGTNLVNGLKNGISNAWSGLMTKVQSLVTSLTNKVKSLFGVASPSKVFAEIGGFLDEGLAQGLENGKRGLLTTAANIANAVTNGMTPDTPQVDMTADSVISGMQAVISNLGGIAATFKTIADALTAIGGFTMPQIAAGTVVPYRTRVDTYAPPTGDSDGVTGYLMGILSELQALAEALRSGGSGQSSEIKLVINGREVFQTVVDENERAIQRTGKSPIRV